MSARGRGAGAPSGGGKTRLTAGLSPDDARALREALLLDTLNQARAAGAPVTLFFTPPAGRDEVRALVGNDVGLEPQGEGDLGHGIAWGTRDALRQTLDAAHAAGWSVALVDPWFDVDVPADLSRVLAGDVAPRTRAWPAAR